jgi:hypothetical protein
LNFLPPITRREHEQLNGHTVFSSKHLNKIII